MKNKKNFVEMINYLSDIFLISERFATITNKKNTVIDYDNKKEIIKFERNLSKYILNLKNKSVTIVSPLDGQEDDFINNIPFKKINFLNIKDKPSNIKNVVKKDVVMILKTLKLLLERYHDGEEKLQVISDLSKKENVNLLIGEILTKNNWN
jgi:hypothetical protein